MALPYITWYNVEGSGKVGNEPYQYGDELVKENAELILKLRLAESEICRLRAALEDATNEVARLDMILKRRKENLESIKRHGG